MSEQICSDSIWQHATLAVQGFQVCRGEVVEFGIDLKRWLAGPRFAGVKMLAPGFHLIHWRCYALSTSARDSSSSSSSSSSSLLELNDQDSHVCSPSSLSSSSIDRTSQLGESRGSLCLFIEKADVAVLDYSARSSEFRVVCDSKRVGDVRDAVRRFELDATLAPFSVDTDVNEDALAGNSELLLERWASMVSDVSVALVKRLVPANGSPIYSTVDADAGVDADGLPVVRSNVRYTQLSAFAKPDASMSSAAERTKYCMDRTAMLRHVAESAHQGDLSAIVGEQQLAFVLFLLGDNYDALEQWKALSAALCSCEDLIAQRADLMARFVRALRCQLDQAPANLFAADTENFLSLCVPDFLELLDDADDATARSEARQLAEFCHAREMSLEPRYRPTVVALPSASSAE
jgi:AAR2 C-terminal repeat region/AAR2 N-terminal domain